MGVILTNNATSTLVASITSSATSLAVQSADAGRFPSPGEGEWFPATIVDAAGNMEIVKVTARSSGTMTIERAQEGTSAADFPAGSRVDLRLTAAAIADLTSLDFATEAEAKAGENTDKPMNSLRTKQVIDDTLLKLTKSSLDALATEGELVVDQLFYITDEGVFARATGASAYAVASAGGLKSVSAGLYEIGPGDAGKTLLFTGNALIAVPPDSYATIPVGFSVTIVPQITLTHGVVVKPTNSTVTLHIGSGGLSHVKPGEKFEVTKVGANTWVGHNSHKPTSPEICEIIVNSGATSTAGQPPHSFGVPGDLWIVGVETAAVTPSSVPSFFTALPMQTTGAAGGTASTALSLYYRVLDGTETNFIHSQTDHWVRMSVLVKNVDPVIPIDVSAGSLASSATTAVSTPAVTTTRNNALVLNFVANATDTTDPQLALGTNPALSKLTIERQIQSTQGNGGGISLICGIKSAPGSTGSTTGTLATASVQARTTIAINPK